MSEIKVFADANALIEAAAELFVSVHNAALASQGRFHVALSGGTTPKPLYEQLASEEYSGQIDWAHTYLFWGDERCVPPDHADSNYRMTRESLLNHVPIPQDHVYRMRGEVDPEQAAGEYEGVLKALFRGENTRFDLLLLGMGDDGHTASLFPHTAALQETQRLVVANFLEAKNIWRITLTTRAINAAANIAFLVSGGAKAERLHEVLKGDYQPEHLPSQLIKPDNGTLLWLVDAAAAAKL
ncbi:MAG: 6-phosphogluconolactonase [Anaerolineae bacterium]